MSDWSDYTDTKTKARKTTGTAPTIIEYIFFKITNKALEVFLILLIVMFTSIAIISNNQQMVTFSLHAVELCLGVFLGMFTNRGLNH